MEISQNLKNEFIEIVLALEPERLYQDGERSREEAEIVQKSLYTKWERLEKDNNISVDFETAEKWAWE